MIEAIEATNASLISFKLNDIMKFLTIISVITFPLTLVAGIFSMRAENGMPFIGLPYGFWIVISIMAILALSMIWFFTKKKWL